jgi:hypothetical protein
MESGVTDREEEKKQTPGTEPWCRQAHPTIRNHRPISVTIPREHPPKTSDRATEAT